MRRWVWSCAGLMVCSGCQSVDRTAWFGDYNQCNGPAVSSVVRSVQSQSCPAGDGGCGPACNAATESPFAHSAPAVEAPHDYPAASQPAYQPPTGTYVERAGTPPAAVVAPPATVPPLVNPLRLPAPPTSQDPPRTYQGDASTLEADEDSIIESSDEPLVDVVIPGARPAPARSLPGAAPRGYPSTNTPNGSGLMPEAEADSEFDIDAGPADDADLVPVKQPEPSVKSAPPAATDSAGKSLPSLSPLLKPPFRAGAAVPIPAKGSRVDPSKLPQAPILLPAR